MDCARTREKHSQRDLLEQVGTAVAFHFATGVNLMRKLLSAILFLACAGLLPAQQTPATHFDGNSWWSHVKFLADDALEGRAPGSEGLRKAEAYAVEQLQKAGLEPAGTKGFFQPVQLIQYQ